MMVYLIGVIIALWPVHKWLKHEDSMSTYTRTWMTLGIATFSWFSVFAVMHIVKRDYEWQMFGKYERLLKQRALLL
jgi:hypothetical protein